MNLLIDRIGELLTASVKTPRGIKAIYKGDNAFIPVASLPALIISPENVEVVMDDNAYDQNITRLAISLVIDARSYLNASAEQTAGLYELVKVMQEETSGNPKNDTVLSVLRKELFYDSDYCQQVSDVRIDYGFGTTREYPTLEAVMTFTVHGKPYLRQS